MSHHGIGVLFTAGPGGLPQLLYIRDVEAQCPVCGHEHLIRWYSSTPYHGLTTARLAQLADTANRDVQVDCEQCGEPMGPADATRWTVHLGFAGGYGLIQGFVQGGRTRWVLSPHRRIDVQLVPEWAVEPDISNVTVDVLDEAVIETTFGRPLSGKAWVRRQLVQRAAQTAGAPLLLAPEAGVLVGLTPAGWDDDTLDLWLQQAGAAALRHGDWQRFRLSRSGELASGFAGAPANWLQDLAPLLRSTDVTVWADAARVFEVADAIVRTFPIPVRIRQLRGTDLLWLRLPNQKDPATAPKFDPRGIALEAARSASSLDDMVRLEIDRMVQTLTGEATESEELQA